MFSPIETALFWTKVRVTSKCWEWKAGHFANGYGSFKWRGENVLAHRIAWMLINGKELGPGEYVLHHCDNHNCVRPDHIYTGSQVENMRDKFARGRDRTPRGDGHYIAKLTADQARAIRERFAAGERNSDLAREFHVTRATICDLIYRRTWQHI